MNQLDMFSGSEPPAFTASAAPLTALPPKPALPSDIGKRLRSVGVQVVGITWNAYFKEWTFQLRGTFTPQGGVTTLSKTAAGLLRTLEAMEAVKQ